MKYLAPIAIAIVLSQMISAVVQAELVTRVTADIDGNEIRCSNKSDCKYRDEECVFVDGEGESDGQQGYCVQHGKDLVPVQFESNGADAEYKHGDHCIDGRTF